MAKVCRLGDVDSRFLKQYECGFGEYVGSPRFDMVRGKTCILSTFNDNVDLLQ